MGGASQFTKMTAGRDLGTYDFRSIMHYSRGALQKEYGRTVLSAPFQLVGMTGGLSMGDVAALNFMYNGCSREYTAPTCMASIDTTQTHVIPHSKPFRVGFASQYKVGSVVTVTYGVTTTPESEDVVFEYPTGREFYGGGGQTSIVFTPSSRQAGKSFVLGVNFGADDGKDTVCFVQVRVARSDNVCFQKEGSDPFVCSGRGVCTDKLLEPCRCDVGTGGPECEGNAGCPRNVADSFDTHLGDWSNSYTTWLDTAKRVGDTGASLRMGREPYSGRGGASLPLWGLTKPSRVSYDMAVRNGSSLDSATEFLQAPYQQQATQCLSLSVRPVSAEEPSGPFVWVAKTPQVERATPWHIIDERFFHFDIAFDWANVLAVVSIDGKEELYVTLDSSCSAGFDRVGTTGSGWLDNFDLHCTSFVPPQHPATSAPPPTEKPTPFPTPQPTQPPAGCGEYIEHSAPTGVLDYPEGLRPYFSADHCFRVVCGGPLLLNFTLLDTADENHTVTVYSFDADGARVQEARYWGRQLPEPKTYYHGDMLVHFVGSIRFGFGYLGFTLKYECAGTPSPTATQAPPTALPTAAPPTNVPTPIPATAVPTAMPPTLMPATDAPTAPPTNLPEFCSVGGETTAPDGTLTHPQPGPPRDPPSQPTYKNGDSLCIRIRCKKQLVLTWTRFDMEADKDFVSLWLEPRLEETVPQLVWKKSGQVLPLEAGYTGDVLIHFKTDKQGVATGISVDWVCADATPAPATPVPVPVPTLEFPDFCEGRGVLLQTPGFVQHPAPGLLMYEPNERVCWRLQCSGKAHIQWTKFHTEWGYDHMHVFQVQPSLQELARRSGHFLPILHREEVQGDALVHFRSDSNIQSFGVAFKWQCL